MVFCDKSFISLHINIFSEDRKFFSWRVNYIFKWKTVSFSLIYCTQCNYSLYNLSTRYRNIILVNWSGRDKGLVLLIGQRRNAHTILIGKPENCADTYMFLSGSILWGSGLWIVVAQTPTATYRAWWWNFGLHKWLWVSC